jgi:hypothetical protein
MGTGGVRVKSATQSAGNGEVMMLRHYPSQLAGAHFGGVYWLVGLSAGLVPLFCGSSRALSARIALRVE